MGTRGGSGNCGLSEMGSAMERMGTILDEALSEPEEALFICFWVLALPETATGVFISFSPSSVGPS